MDARQFLGSVPFFTEVFSDTELDELARLARPAEFEAGSIIIRERDVGDTLYVIAQGTVTVSIKDSGMEKRVATLSSGDFFGEMSVLTGAPRAATVTTQTPIVALEVERKTLQKLLKTDSTLAERIATVLGEKRQTELNELYGSGLWAFYGPPRAKLGAVIATYFAGLPD